AARLITSDDDTSFLNQIGRVESITARANDQLLDFRVAQADLTQLQGTASAATATITASRDQQAALLKKLNAKEAEAERILAKLTAEERARLAAVEAEQQRQATLRAAQTTSRSDGRTDSRNTTPAALPAASGRAAQAVAFAKAQVGKAYVYGATGPNAYDCSGLTGAAYRSAGISLPRTSSAQYGVGTRVSLRQLQPGDLVFYYSPISHVGIYVGNGMIVHAANPRSGVRYASVTSMPFSGGVRL
ncbi:MAG TPA: C40 family peptidase, partial [Dermatophilaceae bacterium]|nr:C40 family peptidase [Dermatophilaceae bacterium]